MARKVSKLSKVNILLGVTGSIAAYKALDLASKLTAAGAVVNTVMTENATRLVRPRSFEAVTGSTVSTNMWANSADYKMAHINLSARADIVVVAPATANIIAKVANGICDDLLSTTLCTCWARPVLLAPAMNNNMWTNPAVQWNVKALREMGAQFIGPETGRLACGTENTGRMAEPEDIVGAVIKIASKLKTKK